MGDQRIGNLITDDLAKQLKLHCMELKQQELRKLTKKTTIPGHHLCILNISAPKEDKNAHFILSQLEVNGRPDIQVYETISKPSDSGHFQVMIGNNPKEPIELPRGTAIASYKKLDSECPLIKGPNIVQNRINEINLKSVDEKRSGTRKLSGKKADEFIRRINIQAPEEYKQRYIDLILKYYDCFTKNEYDLGRATAVKHRIRLNKKKPIYTKQFRIPYEHQEVIEEFVQEMLDKKLIEVSRSRYNSPIFCVKKSNGKWHPVVDLRRINKAAVDDYYSIRDIRSCIYEIGCCRSSIFSTMDLAKGFFQQELEKDSHKFTAFTEHFERLRAYNLKLSIKKSTFGAKEMEYLGFKIIAEGVKPGSSNTKVIKNFPEPKNVKEVRHFIGMASFFMELIPNFSNSSAHLTALTRKDSKWKKGKLPSNSEEAFKNLKKALTSSSVTAYARKDLKFKVYCDAPAGWKADDKNPAINGGIGAMLCQTWEDGKERVIGYESQTDYESTKKITPHIFWNY